MKPRATLHTVRAQPLSRSHRPRAEITIIHVEQSPPTFTHNNNNCCCCCYRRNNMERALTRVLATMETNLMTRAELPRAQRRNENIFQKTR